MGYQLRKIRERAIAGGYLKVPERKPRPMVTRAPGKYDRTFEEMRALAAKQREERAAEKREQARQCAWDKIRTRLGGLFRRKV